MTPIAAQLRELADIQPGERVSIGIARAARRADLTIWRAFNLWYGKARRIEHQEYVAVETALIKTLERAAANDLHELRVIQQRLESMHAQSDPHVRGQRIAKTRYRVRIDYGKSGA